MVDDGYMSAMVLLHVGVSHTAHTKMAAMHRVGIHPNRKKMTNFLG